MADDRARLLLAAPSGLSGNTLLAALLRVPARNGRTVDRGAVTSVPRRLGLGARVVLRRLTHQGMLAWDVDVIDVDEAARSTPAGLRRSVMEADLPDEVGMAALGVLAARELAVAGSVTPDDDRVLLGADVVDTLVDVVACVHAWWLHGMPVLDLWGPLITGAAAGPGAREVASAFAQRDGTSPRELLTPTGAALVAVLGGATTMVPPAGWDVRVASAFARRDGLSPLLATRLA